MPYQVAAGLNPQRNKVMFIATVNEQLNSAVQWAGSGSKLTYAAIGTGVFIGLVLFKILFKSVSGFFHSVGFSFGSGGNSAVAAQPGLAASSRWKIFFVLIVPPACAYAAYVFYPRWFPTIFQ